MKTSHFPSPVTVSTDNVQLIHTYMLQLLRDGKIMVLLKIHIINVNKCLERQKGRVSGAAT